jgi:hypothetical protein
LYHLTSRADLVDCSEFHYNPQVYSHYDPKEYEDYRLWHTKQFGVNPPSGQLLPPQQPGKAFFASVTDPSSPFHVAPERPVLTGKVILLVNENTGSAAASLAALVQDNRLGLIIGTTTANNATGPTGMTPFTLPRTRIMVSLPAEYMERAVPSNGPVVQPDYWVENSVADIQAWRDAAFEKALDAVNAR